MSGIGSALKLENKTLRVFIDDILVITYRQVNLSSGGLALNVGAGTTMQFDNIRIWSLDENE